MQIGITSYPWEDVEALLNSGKLDDDDYLDSDEFEAFHEDADYLTEGKVVGDSYIAYHGMYSDASAVADQDFEGRESFRVFALTLLNEEFDSDVDDPTDYYMAIYKPARVKKLAELACGFDLAAVGAAHRGVVDSEPELLEHPTDYFVQYMEAVVAFVRRAAQSNACITIEIG